MRSGRALVAAGVLGAAALGAGCPNPTSFRQVLHAEEPMDHPPLVLVYDFAVDAEDVVVDSFGPAFLPMHTSHSEPEGRGELLANTLAAAMVEKLRERGIRAERAGARTTPPREAILVKGQFVTVSDDGESPRMQIGLGDDTKTLRVQVQSYQVTESGLRRISERNVGGRGEPLLPVATDGPTMPRPVTSAVISGGLNFVLRSQANAEADAQRLADLFAERAADFYRRQGWL